MRISKHLAPFKYKQNILRKGIFQKSQTVNMYSCMTFSGHWKIITYGQIILSPQWTSAVLLNKHRLETITTGSTNMLKSKRSLYISPYENLIYWTAISLVSWPLFLLWALGLCLPSKAILQLFASYSCSWLFSNTKFYSLFVECCRCVSQATDAIYPVVLAAHKLSVTQFFS